MADANWLRKTPTAPVATSDDDPFAELTRIMGFDPRVPFRNSQQASAQPEPSLQAVPQQVAAPNVDLSDDDLDLSIDLERELMGAMEPELAEAGAPVGPAPFRQDAGYGTAATEQAGDEALPLDQQAYGDWPSDYSDTDEAAFSEYVAAEPGYEGEALAPAETALEEDYDAPQSAYAEDAPQHVQQAAPAYSDFDDAGHAADLAAHLDEELGSSFESEMQSADDGWSDDHDRAYEPQYAEEAAEPEAVNTEADPFAHGFDAAMAEVDMDFSAAPMEARAHDESEHTPHADAPAGLSDDLSTALADELDFDVPGEAHIEATADEDDTTEPVPAYPGLAAREAFDAERAEELQGDDDGFDLSDNPPVYAAASEEEAPTEDAAAQSEIDDAIAELAAMVRGYDRPASAPGTRQEASGFEPFVPAAAAEDVPEIETVDVPEDAIALADDLEIPEIEYSEDAVPAFDDLDAELAAAFGEPAIEPAPPAASEIRVSEDDFDLEAGYDVSASRNAAFQAAPYAVSAGVGAAAAYAAQGRAQGDVHITRRQPAAQQDQDYDFQVDPDLENELALDDEMYAPQKPSPRRGLIVASVVGGIAILGAVGAYALSGGEGSVSGGPALVRADTDPVKVRPENPGGITVPNQDSRVFDRAAGQTAEKPEQQTLISTEEEPVDVAARFPDAVPQPIDESADIDELAADTPPKSEDRVEQTAAADETQPAAGETVAVAPRKVRTMVVKSDGTLVPREEVVGEPETVGSTSATDSLTDPAISTPQPDAAATEGATQPAETAAVQAETSQPATPAGQPRTATRSTMPETVPVAPSRPAEQPVDIVGEVKPEQVAAVAPAAAAPAAGSWSMQIASQPSEAAAQSSYRDLAKRYSSVLGGRQASIVKAEIAGKGTFWRVRVPAESRSEAIRLCESYKAAGGNCFVSK